MGLELNVRNPYLLLNNDFYKNVILAAKFYFLKNVFHTRENYHQEGRKTF